MVAQAVASTTGNGSGDTAIQERRSGTEPNCRSGTEPVSGGGTRAMVVTDPGDGPGDDLCERLVGTLRAMGGPDDDRDDEPGGPRPDPADRPWVHPAELQAFRAAPPSPATPPRPREWAIGLISAMAGMAITLLVLVAFGSIGGRERPVIPPPVVTNPSSPINYRDAQRVLQATRDTVVTVSTDQPTLDGSTSTGSGITLFTDRVVTSAHLLTGATKITITTKSGVKLDAQVIGVDPATDIGLLLVNGVRPDLPQPELVDQPAVGDIVVAVGAGKGNVGWVNIGVVQERNWLTQNGTTTMAGLLATSTLTTPPTSGGGLFDPQAHLIGILTAAPGATRAGLAIPIQVVLDVADQLETNKVAGHGAIGVVLGPDRGATPGAVVAGVVPDGPAAKADPPLERGDLITRANDGPVSDWHDLLAAARRLPPGSQLDLVFQRGGRTQRNRVQLATAPDSVGSPLGPIG